MSKLSQFLHFLEWIFLFDGPKPFGFFSSHPAGGLLLWSTNMASVKVRSVTNISSFVSELLRCHFYVIVILESFLMAFWESLCFNFGAQQVWSNFKMLYAWSKEANFLGQRHLFAYTIWQIVWWKLVCLCAINDFWQPMTHNPTKTHRSSHLRVSGEGPAWNHSQPLNGCQIFCNERYSLTEGDAWCILVISFHFV